jgi:hypothetical protein
VNVKLYLLVSKPTNIDGPITAGLRFIYSSVCHITDEYMELATIKPDDSCIHRFEFVNDEYKIIFVGFMYSSVRVRKR